MKNHPIRMLRQPLRTIFRFIDHLIFAAICAAALWIPFRKDDRVYPVCLCALFAIVFLLAYADKRIAKKKEMQARTAIRESIRIERLLLAGDQTIRAALHEPDLYFIRKKDAGESDFLEAIRTGSRHILIVGDTERWRPLLKMHAHETSLTDARKCLDMLGIACTEEEVNARAAALFEPRKRRVDIRAVSGSRIRFFVLGILLLVLSLVWNHKIYYRLLSAVCFVVPVISGTFGRPGGREIFGNFLDNTDK